MTKVGSFEANKGRRPLAPEGYDRRHPVKEGKSVTKDDPLRPLPRLISEATLTPGQIEGLSENYEVLGRSPNGKECYFVNAPCNTRLRHLFGLLKKILEAYPKTGAEGCLTQALGGEKQKGRDEEPASPRLATVINYYDILRTKGALPKIPRTLFESSIQITRLTGCPWGANPNSGISRGRKLNEYFEEPDILESRRRCARRMAESYIAKGFIQPQHSVCDVGCDDNTFLETVGNRAARCVGIEAREGLRVSPLRLKNHEVCYGINAFDFTKKYPQEKFDVVNCGNISEPKIIPLLKRLVNPNGGYALVGVNGNNPEFLCQAGGELYIRPLLEKNFKKVRWIKAGHINQEEFEKYHSVGGQFGVFECSEPNFGIK